MEQRGSRKTREGVVVSAGMNKTAIVLMKRRIKHVTYGKYILRNKRFYAHDEENACQVGDLVRIMETRPLSKMKRWRVTEILQRAE